MRYFKQIFDAIQEKLKDTPYVINTNELSVKYKLDNKYQDYEDKSGYCAYISIFNPEVQKCGKSRGKIILRRPLISFSEDYDYYSHYWISREVNYGYTRLSTNNIPYGDDYRESYVKAKNVLKYIETSFLDDLKMLSDLCIKYSEFEKQINLSELPLTYENEDVEDDDEDDD